ncbi:MAG: SDR family NAD(P)-dependent oxidoreductase [Sedimentisphaerales bacterium]
MKQIYIDLAGKTVLVTGGGTGIGQALSIAFAHCGCNVVVNYSKSKAEAEKTIETIKKTGGKAIAIQADITDEQEVKKLINKTCEHFDGLDILVANAGGPTKICPTVELSSEQWDKGMALNCKSVFLCVKHSVPRFPQSGGSIIITSSISARSGGGPGMITYAAAKGAINNMVRGWAKEFASKGITVNAIAPGVIRTRIHEQNTSPDDYKKLIGMIPLGRDGIPEDCVGTVLLLASEQGSYITGQIIEINGGMQMP